MVDEPAVTTQPRGQPVDTQIDLADIEPMLSITDHLTVSNVFGRLSALHLHHEWMTESYDSGSYRYLHYTAYGGDGLKVLEGQIETAYDSQLAWCLRCRPSSVQVRLADPAGMDILLIHLTGRLGAHPIDTADLCLPSGNVLATVKWNMPWFEVYDGQRTRVLLMKWPRCVICSLPGEYTILTGDGKTSLGSVEACYSVLGPKWSGEEVLKTYSTFSYVTLMLRYLSMLQLWSVPETLDPRLKAAWVAMMFLLKLGCGGREYAKIVQ